MKTINTTMAAIIAKAAAEAGIISDEKYNVHLISYENGLAEMILETEWNIVTCYADTETGEILGLMAEAKSIEELLACSIRPVRAASLRKAA